MMQRAAAGALVAMLSVTTLTGAVNEEDLSTLDPVVAAIYFSNETQDAGEILLLEEAGQLLSMDFSSVPPSVGVNVILKLLNSRIEQYQRIGMHVALQLPRFASDQERERVAESVLRIGRDHRDSRTRIQAVSSLRTVHPNHEFHVGTLKDLASDETDGLVLVRTLRELLIIDRGNEDSVDFALGFALDDDLESSGPIIEMMAIHLSSPPPALLGPMLDYVKSSQGYGNPNIIQQIPKFGKDAIIYIEDLKDIRSFLDKQIALDPSQRTIPIYNEEFYARTIEDVIMRLSELAAES